MKVLVVDDDAAISEFVGWALADEGHQVARAGNGVDALALLERLEPDLILLDMRMPEMDGWEFARLYRQRPHPPAPIVVLTAARDAAQRAKEIDAAGYLAKPFDLEDLIATVERFEHNHH